jgi:hypothetical protein
MTRMFITLATGFLLVGGAVSAGIDQEEKVNVLAPKPTLTPLPKITPAPPAPSTDQPLEVEAKIFIGKGTPEEEVIFVKALFLVQEKGFTYTEQMVGITYPLLYANNGTPIRYLHGVFDTPGQKFGIFFCERAKAKTAAPHCTPIEESPPYKDQVKPLKKRFLFYLAAYRMALEEDVKRRNQEVTPVPIVRSETIA